ncbi:uncharacterized protein LOC126412902 [Schistocerca serialis cubense]|uniref:uncharacterized protein LOC126412902 n=1 Tax=Schistocerca serialis cubense TaxID=2023355 RepID=UPI00214E956D|nr:uncharacterized protein LOC126412902 [Schistocerca serialis cubense]
MVKQAELWGKEEQKQKHWWWNKECEEVVETCRKAWRDWSRKKDPEKLEVFFGARKEAARTIRWTRREKMEQELEEIETNFRKNNSPHFFGKFKKSLIGYKGRELFIRDKKGELDVSAKENCQIFAEHFHNLLKCKPPEEELELGTDTEEREPRPPTREEVAHAISDLKNNKATGEDGIAAKMIKRGGNKATDNMTNELHQ